MEQAGSPNPQEQLNGTEKAAALLLVMGKESAGKLAGFFSPEELNRLSDTAHRLKTLNIDTINGLVREFGKNYVAHGMFAGSEDLSEIFSMPQPPEEKGNEPAARGETPLNPDLPEIEELAAFMKDAPVHISAFLLGALEDELAAKILSDLEGDQRNCIFKAYLDRNQPEPKVQNLFKNALVELIKEQNESDGSDEKIENAAGIINFFSGDTGDQIVNYIESNDPHAAAIIKKSLFKFEAVVELDKDARSLLFDGVESDDIVKALGTAGDALKESVLEVLSQRNRRMVEAELARGPASQEEIEDRQRKIAGLALKLSKEGVISLPGVQD